MKDFKVDKESWHYKLNEALLWQDKSPRMYPKDFCTYWRHTGYSLILSAFGIILGGGIIFVIGSIIFGAATNILPALVILGIDVVVIGLVALIKFAIIPYVLTPIWDKIPRDKIGQWFRGKFSKLGESLKWVGSYLAIPLNYIRGLIKEAYFYLLGKYEEWRINHPKKIDQPSIVVMKYKAYKSKICPMVEYV